MSVYVNQRFCIWTRFWFKCMAFCKIQFPCWNIRGWLLFFPALVRQQWFTVSEHRLINGDCKWHCSSAVQPSPMTGQVQQFMKLVSGLFLCSLLSVILFEVYPAAISWHWRWHCTWCYITLMLGHTRVEVCRYCTHWDWLCRWLKFLSCFAECVIGLWYVWNGLLFPLLL